MNNILVICTGNTCRSPMAEGIIRDIVQKNHIQDVNVQSMGLSACDGDAPSDYAVCVLEEIGIDIKNHLSKHVVIDDLVAADSIYVMTLQHKEVIVDAIPDIADKIKVIDISDPFGQSLQRYRICRDDMVKYFTDELMGEK